MTRRMRSWTMALGLLFAFSTAGFHQSATALEARGCESDSVWNRSGCILEFPDESRVLSGIRFRHTVSTCNSPYGAGSDGPVYFEFSPVNKSTGELQTGVQYSLEVFFSHDCRDYEGAYNLSVWLVGPGSEMIQASLTEESYHSYTSSRVSSVNNYCLMYSCGRSYFYYTVQLPADSSAGIYSVQARATTDDSTNAYGFAAIDSEFNFSSVFSLTPTSKVRTFTATQKTLASFPGDATRLTTNQKRQVKAAVAANPNATKFICTGIRYISQPMSENIMVRKRAKAACDYAKTLNPQLSTWYQNKPTEARSYAGKVLLTIKSPAN